MSELKPCPKCGSALVHIERNDDDVLCRGCCSVCNYSPDWWETEEESIKYWNTRPIEDALNQRIAELDQIENERGELMLRILGTRNLEALLVQFLEQKKRIAELTIPEDVLETLIFSMNYIVHYYWIGKEYQKALDWLKGQRKD